MLILVEEKQGKQVVSFEGVADETFDPAPRFENLSGEIYVVATKVRRINSTAVKRWIACFEGLRASGRLVRFVGISPAVVEQFNSISNFGAGFPVLTAVMPFTCTACGKPNPVLRTREEALAQNLEDSTAACAHCGRAALEFDDLPEEYLAFWRRSRPT